MQALRLILMVALILFFGFFNINILASIMLSGFKAGTPNWQKAAILFWAIVYNPAYMGLLVNRVSALLKERNPDLNKKEPK